MELKLPQWASVPPVGFPGAIAPSSGKQAQGWDNGEEPAAAHFNWFLQALADTQNEVTTAISGTGGTPSSELTQLLATLLRQQTKLAIASLKIADDTGASQTLRGLCLDTTNRVAVAVGDAASIRRVDLNDTQNFTSATAASSYAGNFADITRYLTIFVAVGATGEIQTSSDGVTWTRQHNGGSNLRAVAASGSALIAVGEGETILRSTSGGAWASQTSAFAGTPDIVSVVYGAGLFVAVTAKGDVATSPTGMTWTVRLAQAGTTYDPSRVDYHASIGFLYHYGPDVWNSPDGITWTKIVNESGISSSADAPGLLVAPYCYALGFSGTDGASCDGRYGTASAVAFAVHYMLNEPLTWWRFLNGQLWALGGDRVFVGGVL